MGNLKREVKGITLISLVLTIIILLILAGITIGLLTGDNGIITQTQRAAEQTEIAQEKEQIALAYNSAVLKNNGEDVTSDDLNEEFENDETNATASGENPIKVTFPETDRTYEIEEDGTIKGPVTAGEETEKGEITATMKIEGTKVTTPPMPTGFSHVEGTVDDGYVIEDENRNQYVWVPVDKDQKLKIDVTSNEEIESIILRDPSGDTILTESDKGITYNNDNITLTINGPYVLTVKTATEEKNFTLGVHSLYARDTTADWFFTEEVALLQGYSSLEEFLMGLTIEEAYTEYAKMLEYYSDTEDYTTSVNNNGGFYIGRYEASEEDGNVEVKDNVIPWTDISQIEALDKSKQMYNSSSEKNFESSLLTGAAWDRTLGWLEDTGAVTSFEIVGDSKTWGNYLDDNFSNTEDLIETGEYEETEKNHIYDLAGNLWEWTTELHSIRGKVYRGGSYVYPGSEGNCSNRHDEVSGDKISYIGFRTALYIN